MSSTLGRLSRSRNRSSSNVTSGSEIAATSNAMPCRRREIGGPRRRASAATGCGTSSLSLVAMTWTSIESDGAQHARDDRPAEEVGPSRLPALAEHELRRPLRLRDVHERDADVARGELLVAPAHVLEELAVLHEELG